MIMLVIRNEQFAALDRAAVHAWLEKYLAENYPERAAAYGRSGVAELIAKASASAQARGFTAPELLRKYVHVAFLLGAEFEQDRNLIWTREILDSPDYKNPASRLRALEDGAVEHLEQTSSGQE